MIVLDFQCFIDIAQIHIQIIQYIHVHLESYYYCY